MKKQFTLLTSIVLLSSMLLVVGCKEDSTPTSPKNIAVAKYVSIGNSLTAGYQSGGLYATAQAYSFPNLIATQLKAGGATIGTFEQPLWGDPGSPDTDGKSARNIFKGFDSKNNPIVVREGSAPGVATNGTLARPYDNLGIPGAAIYDFLDTTNVNTKYVQRKSPFFSHVLRSNATYGASVYLQAKSITPKADLITFWLGNNDVLGFATTGGYSPIAPTSKDLFTAWYNAAVDSLRKAFPSAKIVIATIPDVKAVPFFTTIGPKIKAALPAGYKFYYQKHQAQGAFGVDSTFFTEDAPPLITLKGSTYAALVGTQTFQAWRDLGITYAQLQSAGIDSTAPFGLSAKNPWPDMYVLDPTEQATAAQAVSDFNAVIAAAATRNNTALFDAYTFFNGVKTSGIVVGGVTFTTSFISGGLFSLDGVHPSSQGQGIIANEFIKAINAKYTLGIGSVNIANLPTLAITPLAKHVGIPQIPISSWKSFDALWAN